MTATAVGVAGLAADSLESRSVTPATGWRVIARRRRPIAGWAVFDLAVGMPSRLIGSWTLNQLAVLLVGFGWSLLSFFAIPTIALTGGSPRATTRRSLQLARRHWGDAIYSTVYLWVRAVVVFGAPAAVAVAVGVLLIRNDAVILGGALFAAGVAGLARSPSCWRRWRARCSPWCCTSTPTPARSTRPFLPSCSTAASAARRASSGA